MTSLGEAERTLCSVFGFAAFRPGQAEIVAAVMSSSDVLAVMPTGSGKSLCYQLPALLREGVTVVVSPLIALMCNQVQTLRALGVAAASLNSANDADENRRTLAGLARGETRVLYVAPERLTAGSLVAVLRRARVALLAVDEAHCISQWGHDFRSDYLALGKVQAELGNPQVVALTATADVATRSEIVTQLFRRPPRVFVHGFDRPNVRLAMRPKSAVRKQ
ncbi:MAG: RecQ family ATP-dependent DNA helicase, partial [Alphaproteobacteria bacterium]|nr:RecQ family ATP-dependent DNA helicase [Alphaproteobacteria bacterium]